MNHNEILHECLIRIVDRRCLFCGNYYHENGNWYRENVCQFGDTDIVFISNFINQINYCDKSGANLDTLAGADFIKSDVKRLLEYEEKYLREKLWFNNGVRIALVLKYFLVANQFLDTIGLRRFVLFFNDYEKASDYVVKQTLMLNNESFCNEK